MNEDYQRLILEYLPPEKQKIVLKAFHDLEAGRSSGIMERVLIAFDSFVIIFDRIASKVADSSQKLLEAAEILRELVKCLGWAGKSTTSAVLTPSLVPWAVLAGTHFAVLCLGALLVAWSNSRILLTPYDSVSSRFIALKNHLSVNVFEANGRAFMDVSTGYFAIGGSRNTHGIVRLAFPVTDDEKSVAWTNRVALARETEEWLSNPGPERYKIDMGY